jgi:hypothetical protein
MIDDILLFRLQMLLISGLSGAIFFRLLELAGLIPA